MDSYNQSSLFLVTEGPDERSANRFWEMVWDNDCRLIVMLTPIDDVVSAGGNDFHLDMRE